MNIAKFRIVDKNRSVFFRQKNLSIPFRTVVRLAELFAVGVVGGTAFAPSHAFQKSSLIQQLNSNGIAYTESIQQITVLTQALYNSTTENSK